MITKYACFILGIHLWWLLTGQRGWTGRAHSEDALPLWLLVVWLPLHLWRGR